MRYLIYVNKTLDSVWQSKWILDFHEKFKIVDIEEKQLEQLEKEVEEIEPDEKLFLGNVIDETSYLTLEEGYIYVFIGEMHDKEMTQNTYDLVENADFNLASFKDSTSINLYSRRKYCYTSQLIQALIKLQELANLRRKKLIIYGAYEHQVPYLTYRSLFDAWLFSWLKPPFGIFIRKVLPKERRKYYQVTQRSYEPYSNKGYFASGTTNQLIKRGMHLLNSIYERKPQEERQEGLYDNIFYRLIPPLQKIYIPLNFGEKNQALFERLGLRIISLMAGYDVIYDVKEKIDAVSEQIKKYIYPNFTMPLLLPSHICKTCGAKESRSYSFDDLPYKGQDVYIGMITTIDIDYWVNYLRKEDGKTRVACIWEQTEATDGVYYKEDAINNALENHSVQQGLGNINTQLLGIAAGNGPAFYGPAHEAQILVAKVQKAPVQSLVQEAEQGAFMPDILIGILKLMELAYLNQKPLVIYMPYTTNISSHDGRGIYDGILEALGEQSGFTIIVPMGEEGNKRHHQEVDNRQGQINQIPLRIEGDNKDVMGVLYTRYPKDIRIELTLPNNSISPIDLTEQNIYEEGNLQVVSNGIEIDYSNGATRVLFRLSGIEKGVGQLTVAGGEEGQRYADIWLDEERLNPSIRFDEASVFTTLGSSASGASIFSVGSFDLEGEVVLGASGRGYAWDGTIKPICVGGGVYTYSFEGTDDYIEGTGVASCQLAGSVATLYEKWRRELLLPLPNSLVMENLIVSEVRQLPNGSYPNPSEGYGIWDIQELKTILNVPFSERGE